MPNRVMDITHLLSRAEIRVHLAEDALIACDIRRTMGASRVSRKATFEFKPAGRAGAMEALARWIATAPARRSIVWVVGPADANYFLLPWSPACIDRALRDAYARERFEELFERDALQCKFWFSKQTAGTGQLVSCISEELHAELVAHAERARCELAGIKPTLSTVWNRFRDILEGEQGTLCVIEGDQQTIVRNDGTHIEQITVKIGKDVKTLPTARHGTVRLFSNRSTRMPVAKDYAELNLPTNRGFVASHDSAYSFALCGLL